MLKKILATGVLSLFICYNTYTSQDSNSSTSINDSDWESFSDSGVYTKSKLFFDMQMNGNSTSIHLRRSYSESNLSKVSQDENNFEAQDSKSCSSDGEDDYNNGDTISSSSSPKPNDNDDRELKSRRIYEALYGPYPENHEDKNSSLSSPNSSEDESNPLDQDEIEQLFNQKFSFCSDSDSDDSASEKIDFSDMLKGLPRSPNYASSYNAEPSDIFKIQWRLPAEDVLLKYVSNSFDHFLLKTNLLKDIANKTYHEFGVETAIMTHICDYEKYLKKENMRKEDIQITINILYGLKSTLKQQIMLNAQKIEPVTFKNN